MKALVVTAAGQLPALADFPEPVAGPGEVLVRVAATALCPLARVRASGQHYSAGGTYPLVAGVDGTGTLDDGRPVYFMLPRAPFGSMAEIAPVAEAQVVPLPGGLDPVTAAAIANPGMSSWAALTERARFRPGESVLINGATGASGRLAVQIARHMGASRIVATGRNRAVLDTLGADETIALEADRAGLQARFMPVFARGIDIVLDYLWGPSAEALMLAGAKAGPASVPIRFVQIGTASSLSIDLPGAILRSSALEIMGSGIGSVAMPRLIAATGAMLRAAAPAGLSLPHRTVPLAEGGAAWGWRETERLVFTP
ncbi:quinone oxidoreductase family protein [Zavarzinia aquatilis]|uniref:Alcohol dehydrogenase n=1 Tax=Zavarzinia aquatilis TaxID=2211142 RepID=A0A317E619_9PROT|nr:alcohol dehydrogenase [Zavarzinia aquatilis]PWR22479.1 alcohol dehydrogenase [Zavarzinia aquatilis]